MPVCCVVQCGARRNKNRPDLTHHRFPRNDALKKKWMDIIGVKNINPRHKELYLCSLHFEESAFNRTLDVIRLRDNSVPSSSLVDLAHKPLSTYCQQASTIFLKDNCSLASTCDKPTDEQKAFVLRQNSNIQEPHDFVTTHDCVTLNCTIKLEEASEEPTDEQKISVYTQNGIIQDSLSSAMTQSHCTIKLEEASEESTDGQKTHVLRQNGNIQDPLSSAMTQSDYSTINLEKESEERERYWNMEQEIRKLRHTCSNQRGKIKCLHEQVRKRDKKISALNDIVKDLLKSINK